jgi:hypothetical protein
MTQYVTVTVLACGVSGATILRASIFRAIIGDPQYSISLYSVASGGCHNSRIAK